MTIKWTVSELDAKKLFTIIPSADIETAGRYSLPIPNWLDDEGKPIKDMEASLITELDAHEGLMNGIFYSEKKGEYRYAFYNYEDGCTQAVKIDGTGSIIFTGPTPNKAKALTNIILEECPDIALLSPQQLQDILASSFERLGLTDRFHESLETLHRKMEQSGIVGSPSDNMGLFVFRPIESACIFIQGNGIFEDGPTATPQRFDGGAFIEFTGKSIAEVKKIINSGSETEKIGVKLISKPVFFRSRVSAENKQPINLSSIQGQEKPLKRIFKPKPIGGFPEYSPEIRDIERQWLDQIATTFELYGYINIETPSVEDVAALAGDGQDVDKEVYGLRRLNADDEGDDSRLALHYDLTVPMARYVAQRFNEITFPFKRYQMQKVWRGDRPQRGRFREFIQCDIDVVNPGELSLEFDAEMPVTMYHLVKSLGIGNLAISLNNRKILQGFYQGLGLDEEQIIHTIRAVDKIDKIGADGVRHLLSEGLKLDSDIVEQCIALAKIKETGRGLFDQVMHLGVDSPLLREGLEELDFVMERLQSLPEGAAIADLSIARGLDYYTGTVYEGKLQDYPNFPVVMAGGRYDNLVSRFRNESLPGVGISLGMSRLFSKMVDEGVVQPGRKSPTDILITVPDQSNLGDARKIADDLRARGINVEVFHNPGNLKPQIKYADKKGIPFTLFRNNDGTLELRDMKNGNQSHIDLTKWQPPRLKKVG